MAFVCGALYYGACNVGDLGGVDKGMGFSRQQISGRQLQWKHADTVRAPPEEASFICVLPPFMHLELGK